MDKLKLLIVDNHALFRAGLRDLLESQEDLTVVGEAGRGDEALASVSEQAPDVILLNPHLPDGSGARLCRELLHRSPGSRVLFLSARNDTAEEIRAALVAGASGYVSRTTSIERLARAIRSVHQGDLLLDASVAAKVRQQLDRLRHPPLDRERVLQVLTPRQQQVFLLAGRGLKNTEIAAQLYLSDKTIKSHLRTIYTALDLSSKAELQLLAVRLGLGPTTRH